MKMLRARKESYPLDKLFYGPFRGSRLLLLLLSFDGLPRRGGQEDN